MIYPFFPTIYYSLRDFNGFKMNGFVGMKNYIDNFTDPVFWHSNMNSFKVIAAQILIGGPISLIFAFIINTQNEGMKRFFKTTSFLPSVMNVAVICLMWKMVLQPDWGILDTVLKAVGLDDIIKTWLIDSSTAIWCIAGVTIWQYIGYNMLLLYAGLRSIPHIYFEAARIEGATFIKQSIHITIPLMQEIIKFVLLLSTTGCLSMFAQVSIMTNGGPGDITRTIVFQMFYKAFSLSDFGGADAIAVIFAAEGLLLIAVINRIIARERIEYS